MPEIKNTFLKSKMNKDLDARIIPNGEYRDGQNISISSSEGASVGALENIRGNKLLTNFGLTDYNLEVIGNYVDTANNRIFFFITNFSDSSTNSLRNLSRQSANAGGSGDYTNFVRFGANNYIAYCEFPSESNENINSSNIKFKIIVSGTFLNFSKTHPILGVNLIENLLFWTDNRNQPRKINVETAIANPLTYYTHEDHISVAKYAPYNSISFLDNVNGTIKSTLKNEVDEWLPPFFGAPGQVPINQSHDFLIFNSSSSYTDIAAHLGSGVPSIDIRVRNMNDEENAYALVQNIDISTTPDKVFLKTIDGVTITDISTQLGWGDSGVYMFQIKNPDYRSSFNGDKDLLKEKFVRFSYRFKYDDDEYSLTAPFTQHAFIPEQYGYFTQLDDEKTKESSIVDFMENQITTAGLVIDLPYSVTEIEDKLKLKEIQLLYKTSDEENLKVIADVSVKNLKSTVATVSVKQAGGNYTAGTYNNVVLDSNGAVKGTITVNGAGRVTSAVITSSNSDYSIGQEFNVPALGGPPTGSGAILTVTSLGSKYVYNYTSQKPTKVLPEKEIVRVSDIVPMRAASQEAVGNRIIYGNFLQNNKSLEKLDYSLAKVNKGDSTSNINKEFLNHTLKQGRSYQVGVVLQDRYGRSSNVIINDASNSSTNLTSTIFSSYTNGGTNPLTWPGDSLQVSFNEPIPTEKKDDYNGVWIENENPLGWYTYKVVVQQKEQDYYNVYTPGALTGNVIYTGAYDEAASTATPLTYSEDSSVSHIALFNDNINKIPRELKEVGPSDDIYSSNTVLFNRVKQLNYSTTSGFAFVNQQNSSPKKIEVTNIKPFIEMGDWTTKKNLNLHYLNATSNTHSQYPDPTYIYPGPEGNVDPLYLNNNKNPLVATLKTKNRLGFKGVDQGSATFKFAKNLMVFETKPFKSALDIYYETSTSGKIQELNESIANSITDFDSKAPNDISDFLTDGFLETATVGSTVTNVFQIINSNSTPVQDISANITIEEVKNGNGAVVTSPFNISQVSAPSAPSTPATFKLVAATRIVFDANSDVENSYTIKFRLHVDGFPDVLVDKDVDLTNIQPKIYRISTTPDQQTYPGIYGSLIENTGIQPFLNTNGVPANYLTDLDANNPQPFNPSVSWSGEYAIVVATRDDVNLSTDNVNFKHSIADISHTSNGYDPLSLPYNENNFNRFPVSSTPRLQGLTYRIKSAIRYDAYAYSFNITSIGATITRYLSVVDAQNTAVNKVSNFIIDTNSNTGQATLSFTIPGGGKISKSELPDNYPGQNQYKGSWLYDVIIDVSDASGSTGFLRSNEYHVQFLIKK